jgi:hypothetical protein
MIRIYFSETQGARHNVLAGVDSEMRNKHDEFLQALAGIFESGMARGRFRRIADPYHLAIALESVTNGFLMQGLFHPARQKSGTHAILDIIFKALPKSRTSHTHPETIRGTERFHPPTAKLAARDRLSPGWDGRRCGGKSRPPQAPRSGHDHRNDAEGRADHELPGAPSPTGPRDPSPVGDRPEAPVREAPPSRPARCATNRPGTFQARENAKARSEAEPTFPHPFRSTVKTAESRAQPA